MVSSRTLLALASFLALWCVSEASLSAAYGGHPPSRCGIDRVRSKLAPHPVDSEHLKREMEIQEENLSHRKRSSTPIYIPIHYHILYDVNNQGLLDDETVYYQTFVLNGALNKHGYYFYTKTIERVLNTLWTSDCETYAATIGSNLADEPEKSMNVYSCVTVGVTDDDGKILGFTYLPGDYPAADTHNAVFVGYDTFPNGGAAYYNQGDTLVHETGHYIGLLHTFEGGCSLTNDGVSDTPACEAYTGIECPSDRDSCPSLSGDDDVRNYMDYSIDTCLNHFTNGQIARVDTQVGLYKPLFASNTAVSDPNMNFPPFEQDPDSATSCDHWIHNAKSLL